jgi:glyoxylase-like metal-dependent hydrolase (beta-lactamase superfamily II)
MRYALLICVLAAAPAFAQELKIVTTPVAGPISMIEGRGGNIGISSGEDGMLMIDTQYANISGPIEDELRKIVPGGIKWFIIINTHFHDDHTSGNANFGPKAAAVIAQENVRTRLLNGKDLTNADVRKALPVITYADTASVYINGETVTLTHLPKGHTDGDTLLHFTKSNVFHTGDQFTNGMYPFIDTKGGGSVDGYLANVAKMIEIIPDDAKIIPGHGPLATKKDLLTFQETLKDTIGIIRKAKSEGKSIEDVQKAGLPAKYDSWGKAFVSTKSWISIIYSNS